MQQEFTVVNLYFQGDLIRGSIKELKISMILRVFLIIFSDDFLSTNRAVKQS